MKKLLCLLSTIGITATSTSTLLSQIESTDTKARFDYNNVIASQKCNYCKDNKDYFLYLLSKTMNFLTTELNFMTNKNLSIINGSLFTTQNTIYDTKMVVIDIINQLIPSIIEKAKTLATSIDHYINYKLNPLEDYRAYSHNHVITGNQFSELISQTIFAQENIEIREPSKFLTSDKVNIIELWITMCGGGFSSLFLMDNVKN